MRRAAYGLATAIARELRLRTGGVAGRRVCAVVGSGDNGGDALWAATFLRRRGASAPPRSCSIRSAPTAKALAAFRRAGGRVVESVPPATDLVIDGVVGISGSRPAAAGRRRGVRRHRRCRHPGRRRRHPQRHRRADRRRRRPARARRADRHLRRAQTRSCAGRLRPGRTGRHRPGPAADRHARASRPPTSRRRWPVPGPTRRQVHPGRHRRAGRLVDLSRVRPSCAPAPPWPPRRAWCATREARPPRWFRTGPR